MSKNKNNKNKILSKEKTRRLLLSPFPFSPRIPSLLSIFCDAGAVARSHRMRSCGGQQRQPPRCTSSSSVSICCYSISASSTLSLRISISSLCPASRPGRAGRPLGRGRGAASARPERRRRSSAGGRGCSGRSGAGRGRWPGGSVGRFSIGARCWRGRLGVSSCGFGRDFRASA